MPGDRIRLGRGGGADLVFLLARVDAAVSSGPRTGARGDLRQITVLLEGFRALGSGRVLQEVLALVLDAAIEISGAERAFIMLADAASELEFKLARGRADNDADRQHVRDQPQDSRGGVPHRQAAHRRRPARRRARRRAHGHRRARHPQRRVRAAQLRALRRVGRGATARTGASACCISTAASGARCCPTRRARALETLAAEASVAIENARLYRDKLEKARMEQEMRIAAEIQQALLPKPRAQPASSSKRRPRACRAGRSAATSSTTSTCRTASFGFTLGDVAGKGPPAALMSAMMQGMFAAQAHVDDEPAIADHAHEQGAVPPRPRVAVRDADVRHRSRRRPLTYCNAGHNPPLVIGKSGVRRLEAGGPVVGLLEFAPYEQETVKLDAGRHDRRLQRRRVRGAERRRRGVRRRPAASHVRAQEPRRLDVAQALVERIVARVRAFTKGAAQSDDITVMVVRYPVILGRPDGRAALARGPRGWCSAIAVWNGFFDLLRCRAAPASICQLRAEHERRRAAAEPVMADGDGRRAARRRIWRPLWAVLVIAAGWARRDWCGGRGAAAVRRPCGLVGSDYRGDSHASAHLRLERSSAGARRAAP